MRRKITLLFVALLACTGVLRADEILGIKNVPETALDLSTTELTTGYYLIKQTNTAEWQGFLKAASETDGAVVTPDGAPVGNNYNESVYIWYVEVYEGGKISISTANKVAGWQAPTQRQKNLVPYDNKAVTLELEKDFSNLNGTTQTLVKAYWADMSVYSYVHASSHNLGSWNDQNTASLFYLEFYAVPESELLYLDNITKKKMELADIIAEESSSLGVFPLQTSNPDGAYYLSATQQGDAHISAAIDKEPGTHYGSTWSSEVGSHHYWQVDLGEGTSLDSFVFSYVTRENGKDTPLQINIKGSDDGIDFTNTILTLTKDEDGLPIEGGTSYTSAVIGNPENYRYIRFEVPSTTTNYSHPNKPEQEVTIAIAEFSMGYTDETLWPMEQQSLKALFEEIQQLLDNPDVAEEELDAAYVSLKKALVKRPAYPFVVTTDDKAPILYGIKSGRTNNNQEWWYRYNMTDGTISLTQYADEEAFYWYFKEVFTDDYVYALQLCPYVGEGVMSYENTTDGPNKVVAKNPEAEDWSNLWILATTNGAAPYGLQTYDKANYLSNNGGVGNKMGMWHDAPANDGGTAMYFTRVDLPMLDIAPSNAEALDSITHFTITCDEGISVAESFHAILTNSEEYIVEISAEQVNETTVELVLPNTLKVEGTYMLNIQDGSFKLGTIYPHLSSYASEEVRMTYEIMDKTPLVLVSSSIENGAVVDAFKDVEMTFSHALAKVKKTDKLPYLVNNDGEVVSAVSFTYQDADGKWYDDNTIRFVVEEHIGVSGVYTLVIPAKFITVLSGWRVRATEDIRLSVALEVSALVNPVMNIAPSNETPLESISNFTITCEQGISIAETFYASFTNWMSYNVELTAEQVNETTIVLALPETLKSEGSYMLSIAPGSFKLDPNGLNVASDETYMMFEVVDNTPFSFVSSSIENGSVVDSISDIVLTFSHNIMEIPTDENLPYILDAEGEVVSQVEYTYQDAEGNWYEEFNVIRFVVTEAITTPGAYTFVMPKEFIVKGSDYVTTVSEDIKINIVVASNEEAAIRNFEVVGSDVIYTITGKAVQGDVKTLERGIYIVNGKKVFVK